VIMHCPTITQTNHNLFLHDFSSTTSIAAKNNIYTTTHHPLRLHPSHLAASACSARLEPRGRMNAETLQVPSTRRQASIDDETRGAGNVHLHVDDRQ